MSTLHALSAVLALWLMTGTAAVAEPPPVGDRFAPFPTSFTGTLPCADCPGIEVTLDLRADGIYYLRRTYLERADATFDDIGRWSLADGTLTLQGTSDPPMRLKPNDDGGLRMLDLQGREIQSDLDYDLARRDDGAPLEPELTLRGRFTYMADAARFQECLTGLDLPVAMEADYLALERAYLAARTAPEPLLVSLMGVIVPRPAVDREGAQDTLRAERLIGTHPGEDCGVP